MIRAPGLHQVYNDPWGRSSPTAKRDKVKPEQWKGITYPLCVMLFFFFFFLKNKTVMLPSEIIYTNRIIYYHTLFAYFDNGKASPEKNPMFYVSDG